MCSSQILNIQASRHFGHDGVAKCWLLGRFCCYRYEEEEDVLSFQLLEPAKSRTVVRGYGNLPNLDCG